MSSAQIMVNKARPSVVVVADWDRCARAVHWQDELRQLTPRVINDFLVIPLADWITHAKAASFLQELASRHVLILNFDSINGDPAFGSDIALDWFRHRYPELLRWVAQGGILLVEGQAMLSVPTQASYDALFGHRELRVSGPSVTPVPGVERNRTGGECQITSKAKEYNLFAGPNRIMCTTDRTLDDFFPGDAKLMLSDASEQYNWKLLYRGWFSRLPIFGCRFPWVTLIKTDRKRFNQAVLMGARHGNGVMFVSTMLLAGTSQTELIRSLMQWNARDNPLPTSRPRLLNNAHLAISVLISIGAGVITTEVLRLTGVWRIGLQWLLWAGFSVTYWLVIWVAQWARRTGRDFLGM